MKAQAIADAKYLRQLKVRAYVAICGLFPAVCYDCGCDGPLEMAHLKPTRLHGFGRGTKARYLDAIRHSDCYILLCKQCHAVFDGRA